MSTSTEEDILGGSAARPGPASAPGYDVLGGAATAGAAAPTAPPPPVTAAPVAKTEAGRLAESTRAGALRECPLAYATEATDVDWKTINAADDPFRVLYLDYRQWATITDEQVQTNGRVLAEFWDSRLKLLIRGGDRLKARFGENTIEQAPKRLEKAVRALADAAGRQAYATQLDNKRLQSATDKMDPYVRDQLANDLMKPAAIQLAVNKGVSEGFSAPEAEQYVLANMRAAGFAPVRTVGANANTLLLTWTPGGAALANQASTTVMGEKVYSLAEAGQVLYRAMAAGDEKAIRNLDSEEYLADIAQDLKEPDAKLDVREIHQSKKLNVAQRRLRLLYLLGPGLPFHLDGVVPEFASPADLLARTAQSAKDFGVAEAAFTAGVLPLWLQAAGTADVRAALPATSKNKALDFRRFLHQAAPDFPLWIGNEAFASPAALAAYIRRDENTWKMVYGSLTAGNLVPWLAALGQSPVLARQEELATRLLGPGLDPKSEPARLLTVQALLEALEPQATVPAVAAEANEVSLAGLSGENQVEQRLAFVNQTGGAVRVFLALEPALDGVALSASELFFDQRAPGQRLVLTLSGDPTRMPRDGQHSAQLHVRTAYAAAEVPVRASAVFPQKEFWQFVVGAGLALAAILGGGRFLLGLALTGSAAQALLERGGWVPLSQAADLPAAEGLPFLLALLVLGGLLYAFGRKLAQLAKPRPTL